MAVGCGARDDGTGIDGIIATVGIVARTDRIGRRSFAMTGGTVRRRRAVATAVRSTRSATVNTVNSSSIVIEIVRTAAAARTTTFELT